MLLPAECCAIMSAEFFHGRRMIYLKNIYKNFGPHRILCDLNLHVPRGKITILIGRSGGGKSVTLKHIIGLVAPDAGEVLIDGTDITTLKSHEINEVRRKFGMLFQDAALFDSMTVFENVAFPLAERTKLTPSGIYSKVIKTLESVGLVNIETKMPGELSGGMRKRVGLARAIVMDPEIILYDEPTTGLDPLMSDTINKLIVETQQRLDMTTFIISHDLGAAFRIADKIAVLFGGQIVAEGPPALIRNSDHPFVQAFVKGEAFDEDDEG
jgi:phospholipid/cholesterol/gamma-HCH transport system ATP-binding protein